MTFFGFGFKSSIHTSSIHLIEETWIELISIHNNRLNVLCLSKYLHSVNAKRTAFKRTDIYRPI